ncbi:hypothetical protein FJTKL_01577 [Diaporthe vaccinii]|uniref:Uncharacterized protein n=1 Tax=Diaporthe vaccinii TaxID=105482 RepID=A0ABR4E087_9PEZI
MIPLLTGLTLTTRTPRTHAHTHAFTQLHLVLDKTAPHTTTTSGRPLNCSASAVQHSTAEVPSLLLTASPPYSTCTPSSPSAPRPRPHPYSGSPNIIVPTPRDSPSNSNLL